MKIFPKMNLAASADFLQISYLYCTATTSKPGLFKQAKQIECYHESYGKLWLEV